MAYSVQLKESASEFLNELPAALRLRIFRKIEALGENPYPPGNRKLKGEERAYRIRVGDYRVVYEVYEDLVLVFVLRIGPRKDVYR
jgi:mRNA interferase RelE/StbE